MPIVRCWTVADFPEARKEMTATYQKFANPTTRGRPIRVEDSDRTSLSALTLTPIEIPPYIDARVHSVMVPDDILLNRELTRVVGNILNSVGRAGTERSGFYPNRHALSFSDLFQLLQEVWRRQNSRCNLCNGPIELGGENPLLKMSPDRSDSANKSYDGGNVHLTHVGCISPRAPRQWSTGKIFSFSQRDMVGCEHRSFPLSGKRPQASLKAGSLRK